MNGIVESVLEGWNNDVDAQKQASQKARLVAKHHPNQDFHVAFSKGSHEVTCENDRLSVRRNLNGPVALRYRSCLWVHRCVLVGMKARTMPITNRYEAGEAEGT